MDPREKMRTKYHFHRPGVDAFNMAKLGSKDKVRNPDHRKTSQLLFKGGSTEGCAS